MINVAGRSFSIMIIYAIILHLSWSVILLLDTSAVDATALHALSRWVHDPTTLSIVIALCAIAAFSALNTVRPTWVLLLLLPQQILLMMSASGCVEAIWNAQFADGVIRPRGFIAADQLYSVLAAAGHTAAIIRHALIKT